MSLLLQSLLYLWSRRATGPKKVLWAINGINTKVALWPFQTEDAVWDGRNICVPQALHLLSFSGFLQTFFIHNHPSHTHKSSQFSGERSKGDPELCFWAANEPSPLCSASPQPQHAREQFQSRAVSRLTLRSRGATLLPVPTDLKMRVP